jgi:hypothetical protein
LYQRPEKGIKAAVLPIISAEVRQMRDWQLSWFGGIALGGATMLGVYGLVSIPDFVVFGPLYCVAAVGGAVAARVRPSRRPVVLALAIAPLTFINVFSVVTIFAVFLYPSHIPANVLLVVGVIRSDAPRGSLVETH